MGKHDKVIEKSSEEFTENRIKNLEAENATLKNTIKALESDNARLERANERAEKRAADTIDSLKSRGREVEKQSTQDGGGLCIDAMTAARYSMSRKASATATKNTAA